MKNKKVIGLSLLTAFILSGCVTKQATIKEKKHTMSFSKRVESRAFVAPKMGEKISTFGKASWYSDSYQGKRTASGEPYDMHKKTAAHRSLPFNTLVKVTDMVTNKSTIVRINDRGPMVKDRIIDLSRAAAKSLGLINRGTTDVRLEILSNYSSIEKNEECSGGKCFASTIIPKKIESFKPFKLSHVEEIESVERPTVSRTQSNPYLTKSKSKVEYDYSASPFERDHVEQLDLYDIHKISSKISIQVGAFRRYAGAKVYAKRYSLLTDRYNVKIKKEFKDARPIYRVHLQGFDSDREAKKFIRQYGIDGAFLVRK